MLLGLPWVVSLKGCGRSSRFNPSVVLGDLRKNEAIGRMRDGRITFNYHEIFTENGKEALKIIQRGLFALDLIRSDPDDFRFGVYGPQTTRAVRVLQARAGMEGDGKKFDQKSLLVMEEALQQKINGR